MKEIQDWFKDQDYFKGVEILEKNRVNNKIVKNLKKRKSQYNISILIYQLRLLTKSKNTVEKNYETKPVSIVMPHNINKDAIEKQLISSSVKKEYEKIKIGDLPAELRVRYSKSFNIFVQMLELKIILNNLPGPSEDSALKIMLQIDALDNERDLIWKELRHWQKFKTILPSKIDDFTGLSELQLDQKKRNLKSNISKIKKRVNILYELLILAKKPKEIKELENKINNSEKRIHTHNLNITKINKLI